MTAPTVNAADSALVDFRGSKLSYSLPLLSTQTYADQIRESAADFEALSAILRRRDHWNGYDALEFVVQGNVRAAQGELLFQGKHPAIKLSSPDPSVLIYTCIDPRLVPTQDFDCPRGFLSVKSTAGAYVTRADMPDLAFPGENFGKLKLILVVDHTRCGKVGAALGEMGYSGYPSCGDPTRESFGHTWEMARHLHQCFCSSPDFGGEDEKAAYMHHGLRIKGAAAVRSIVEWSPTVRRLQNENGLVVASGIFDLDTGLFEVVKCSNCVTEAPSSRQRSVLPSSNPV